MSVNNFPRVRIIEPATSRSLVRRRNHHTTKPHWIWTHTDRFVGAGAVEYTKVPSSSCSSAKTPECFVTSRNVGQRAQLQHLLIRPPTPAWSARSVTDYTATPTRNSLQTDDQSRRIMYGTPFSPAYLTGMQKCHPAAVCFWSHSGPNGNENSGEKTRRRELIGNESHVISCLAGSEFWR